ncbi:MAG: sensor histidine kinase [Gemmatimonadota bacterium]
MGEVASSIGLQAVVGAIARTAERDFDLPRTLTALAEMAQGYAGAAGVSIEQSRDGMITPLLAVGRTAGTPRRLPIIADGLELGFVAIYGAAMLGPATADRTQVIADLAALAFTRAAHALERTRPALDEERYRLITGVGLNLRNTLGAASGYLQLVEMDGALQAGQHEYVGRSRRAITAAVGLIGDLLDLARADAGKLSFECDPVNLNAIAREAARKHNGTAEQKGCAIEVITSERKPVILTDPSHVQEIVDVLVYNAVRYTPAQGTVTVSVDMREGRRSGDPGIWLCVAVKDTGAGVPDADKVFEEVHRVERSGGNVRFKLAICRRVARLLGGDLQLETVVNGGSTFTLWLPGPAPH